MPAVPNPGGSTPICDLLQLYADNINGAIENVQIVNNGQLLLTRNDGNVFTNNIPFFSNRVISGFTFSVPTFNTINIAAGVAQVNAKVVNIAAQNYTFPPCNPTLNRVDAIVVDDLGNISYSIGTPGNPATPPIFNPFTELVLFYISAAPIPNPPFCQYEVAPVNIAQSAGAPTPLPPGTVFGQVLMWDSNLNIWRPTGNIRSEILNGARIERFLRVGAFGNTYLTADGVNQNLQLGNNNNLLASTNSIAHGGSIEDCDGSVVMGAAITSLSFNGTRLNQFGGYLNNIDGLVGNGVMQDITLINTNGVSVSGFSGANKPQGLTVIGHSPKWEIYRRGETLILGGGRVEAGVQAVGMDYEMEPFDHYILVTGSITIDLLPTFGPYKPELGRLVVIKSLGNFTITINGNGHNIEGNPTLTLTGNYAVARLLFNSAEWVQV